MQLLKARRDKIKFYKNHRDKVLFIFIISFASIGSITLYNALAATGLSVDSTLPIPKNVKTYGDDRVITVTWEGNNDSRVVGYYLTYRRANSNDEWIVRQSEAKKDQYREYANAIQLQPVENGVEYEIYIQSAAGSYEQYDAGPLTYGGLSTFAVANGKVSNKSTRTTAVGSSKRVDLMREKYTGFFDDFDQVAGPFNELLWNNANNDCVVRGGGAAFINAQVHAHNMVKSDGQCDRAGNATRPRAVFDMTGATTQKPAELAIDIDGISHSRDTWYIDVIPLSAHSTNRPIDITSHNDKNDQDTLGPGNMVRINAVDGGLTATYYDYRHIPTSLSLFDGATSCGQSYRGATVVRYNNCNWSQKVSGLSPLPEPDFNASTISNVRRHWVVQFDGDKMKIFIDSTLIAESKLPSEFINERKYTVHSTVFSYNTGKDTKSGPVPYVELIHWDNMGFTGPPSQEVVHSYLEGGVTGKEPAYAKGRIDYTIPQGNRDTIIPIPDQIGNLKNGVGYLYFTAYSHGFNYYNWSPNDYINVNGKTYKVPSMSENSGDAYQVNNIKNAEVYNFILPINQADIKQGDNKIQFRLSGNPNGERNTAASLINVHMELVYDIAANIPSYTQPLDIFGQKFLKAVEPSITNCDMYRMIEQDLGLPYQSGKSNLKIGTCELLTTDASQHDGSGSGSHTPPPPAPNNPTSATLSSSSTSTTAPASFNLNATATDIDGTITKLELRQGSNVLKTCSSSPCTYNATNVASGSYNYTAVATDDDGATTTSSQVTVTVSQPTPPPTSNRFETLPVNANLPSDAECASRVRAVAEIRPANQIPNNTRGVGGNYTSEHTRVTGNFTGTTDEIMQWAACKHGMDEDILRAQMVQESYWHQSAIGDFTNGGASLCSPVYPPGNYPPQYNGDSTHTNQCPESYGLSQVRWTYHKSAFYKATSETTANLTNNAIYSTAYNVDYWGSVWRNCYNGNYTWLNTVDRGKDYVAGDAWGCLGMWFSGRWYTNPATTYISAVQSNLNNRVWETTAFKNSQPVNTIPGQTTPPVDSIPPTVSITAPSNNATVRNTVTVSANASDNVGVARVSFYLDNSSTPFSNDSTAPYSTNWNSALTTNGTHTIRATAYDAAGNVSTPSVITISVDNTVPDTTAPSTSITNPSNNATVSDTLTISANASDNVGVSKVELLINGQVAATDLTSPYSFSLNTTLLSDGNHELRTRAFDAAGNSSYSSIVTITVDNIANPPQLCEDETAINVNEPLPCIYEIRKTGDINNDGKVDVFDLSRLLANWNKTTNSYDDGDVNDDGVINVFDLSIVLANWGA